MRYCVCNRSIFSRYWILSGLLVFTSSIALCQNQIIDSNYLQAKYSFKFKPDSTNISRVSENIFVLEVGSKFSKYSSYYKQISDSIISSNSNEPTGVSVQMPSADFRNAKSGSTQTILRNLSTNTYYVSHKLGSANYRFTDSLISINWIFKTDTATIGGFKCNKATTRFRGRNYEAWFTSEIPVSAGPSFFSGLPGLIVKVQETKGNFEFSLLSLEMLSNKRPMYLSNKKSIPVSRKDYRKIVELMHNDIDAFAISHGMILKTKSIDGNSNPPRQRKIPYNPMELE